MSLVAQNAFRASAIADNAFIRLELPRTPLYAGYSAPEVSPTRELF